MTSVPSGETSPAAGASWAPRVGIVSIHCFTYPDGYDYAFHSIDAHCFQASLTTLTPPPVSDCVNRPPRVYLVVNFFLFSFFKRDVERRNERARLDEIPVELRNERARLDEILVELRNERARLDEILAAGTDLDNSGGGDSEGGGNNSALEALGGVAGAAALSAFLFVFVVGMVVMTTLWWGRVRAVNSFDPRALRGISGFNSCYR